MHSMMGVPPMTHDRTYMPMPVQPHFSMPNQGLPLPPGHIQHLHSMPHPNLPQNIQITDDRIQPNTMTQFPPQG